MLSRPPPLQVRFLLPEVGMLRKLSMILILAALTACGSGADQQTGGRGQGARVAGLSDSLKAIPRSGPNERRLNNAPMSALLPVSGFSLGLPMVKPLLPNSSSKVEFNLAGKQGWFLSENQSLRRYTPLDLRAGRL